LPLGPITSPKPGPTFDIAEAEPDSEVTKSKPFNDNRVAKIKKMKKMYTSLKGKENGKINKRKKMINTMKKMINTEKNSWFPYP
jgi:hypothetical protein